MDTPTSADVSYHHTSLNAVQMDTSVQRLKGKYHRASAAQMDTAKPATSGSKSVAVQRARAQNQKNAN